MAPTPRGIDTTAVRESSRRMVRELGFLGDRCLADVGHAQAHVLVELERLGEATAGELTSTLLIDKAAVSRTLTGLMDAGLIARRVDASDRRRRPVRLTARGRRALARVHATADEQVSVALGFLSPDERAVVEQGLALYAKALARRRLQRDLTIRPIRRADDAAMAAIIRSVMGDFGAVGEGYSVHDPEVDAMSRAYRGSAAGFFVITDGERVLGGGGFAALTGGEPHVCELRKMYFLPELRGRGMGARLLTRILDGAYAAGFTTCYLETLEHMISARRLYEAFGFARLDGAMGNTGHCSCDAWYALDLPHAPAS